MATQVITCSKLWLDGYDLSGRMNALALNVSADMQEDTVLCSDTHTMKGGLKSVTMAHEGFFSGGDGDVDDVLFDSFALAGVPVSIGPVNSGADGELAYFMKATMADYSPGAAVGEMFAFSVTAENAGDGLVRGTIMHNAVESGSGSGTARQLGAVASGEKMYAVIHVISGTGTLDVVVQSDDNSGMTSETNRITFTQATGVTAELLSVDGPITDDWWMVDFTVTGSFEFVVILGIK